MPSVNLDEQEWQLVINALVQTNPVLMKIADQLRRQGGNGGMPVRPEAEEAEPKRQW